MFHLGYQKPIHAALVCLDTNMLIASYLACFSKKRDAGVGSSVLQRALCSFFVPCSA